VLKVKVLPGVQVLNGATTTSASGYIAEDRISSYLGRLSYNFKENILLKVLLEERFFKI
jgi:hypothetical protein